MSLLSMITWVVLMTNNAHKHNEETYPIAETISFCLTVPCSALPHGGRWLRAVLPQEDLSEVVLSYVLASPEQLPEVGLMAVDASFSLSPRGLEEVYEVICQVVPEQPLDQFTSTWGKLSYCLDCASEWASAQRRSQDSRMLRRLSSLLTYGHWGATPLDLPPHPKISGLCLCPASYQEVTSAWYDHVQWKQKYLVPELYRCGKWLNILAWHFSRKPNRIREFEWCRRSAWLLREARRSLRMAQE